MSEHESFHSTPRETYDRLVTLFGETTTESEQLNRTTRWVSIGAGTVTLTFFPECDDIASSERAVARGSEARA